MMGSVSLVLGCRVVIGNADGVMDGELLGTDDGLLGGNDGNAVGLGDGSEEGTDDGTAWGISVCRAESVDDVVTGGGCGGKDVFGDECVVGVVCISPQQVAISSEISSGVHKAHVEEASVQDD